MKICLMANNEKERTVLVFAVESPGLTFLVQAILKENSSINSCSIYSF